MPGAEARVDPRKGKRAEDAERQDVRVRRAVGEQRVSQGGGRFEPQQKHPGKDTPETPEAQAAMSETSSDPT